MKKLFVIVLVALLLAGCMPKVEDCMAIEFNGSNSYIEFASATQVQNLTQRSVSAWIYLDDVNPADDIQEIIAKTGGGWAMRAFENDFFFVQAFSGGAAQWGKANVFSASTLYHVAVTYDGSSASNDPILYINGAAQVLDSDLNSTGDMGDDSDGSLIIAASTGGLLALDGIQDPRIYNALDGKIQDPRIYNVILTPAEIAEIYNSRCQRTVSRGLIFAPVFDGAAGLSKFDGATLGTANTIVDWVSGAIGIPYGNPIGRGNTEQRIY